VATSTAWLGAWKRRMIGQKRSALIPVRTAA
jgi:hypothetical protein